MAGQLPAGTPLVQRDLAKQLGVSPTPVRAGLSQLEREGLVAVTATGRAVVSRLTREDFEEIYAARLGLEGLAARVGAVSVGQAEIARMKRTPAPPARSSPRSRTWTSTSASAGSSTRRVTGRAAGSASSTRWSGCSGAPIATTGSSSRPPSASGSPSAATGSFLAACEARDGAQAEQAVQDGMRWAVDRMAASLPSEATSE